MFYHYCISRHKKYLSLIAIAALILGSLVVGFRSVSSEPDLQSLLAESAQAAAVDYFLKIEGVEGGSMDERHKGEIELESFSWSKNEPGLQQSSAGAGGGAGKVNVQDFHFVMKVNKASPELMLACATGKHFKEAVLTVRKAGREQQEFLKWEFKDIFVTSYQTGGSGDIIPTDQITINFAEIAVEYKPQKPDGTLDNPVKAGFDVKSMKKQ